MILLSFLESHLIEWKWIVGVQILQSSVPRNQLYPLMGRYSTASVLARTMKFLNQASRGSSQIQSPGSFLLLQTIALKDGKSTRHPHFRQILFKCPLELGSQIKEHSEKRTRGIVLISIDLKGENRS